MTKNLWISINPWVSRGFEESLQLFIFIIKWIILDHHTLLSGRKESGAIERLRSSNNIPCWALSGTGASSSASGTGPAWWSVGRGKHIVSLRWPWAKRVAGGCSFVTWMNGINEKYLFTILSSNCLRLYIFSPEIEISGKHSLSYHIYLCT